MCKNLCFFCEILIQPRQTHTHIALCTANRWSVSPSGACGSGGAVPFGPADSSPARPTLLVSNVLARVWRGWSPWTRSRGGHGPASRHLCRSFPELGCVCVFVCVFWSGGAGFHRPAPEGGTDQRSAVQSAMCVWVWRGWISSPKSKPRSRTSKSRSRKSKSRSK